MRADSTARRALRALKVAAFRLLDQGVRACVRKGRSEDTLVLKLDALGDLFIWFSSGITGVSEYCRGRPGRSLILVRHELVEFVRSLHLFDEVRGLDARKFLAEPLYRVRELSALRRRGFREVLQVRVSRQFFLEDSIANVVGAPTTRGPVGDRRNLPASEATIGDRFYTPLVVIAGNDGHDIDRNALVAEALIGSGPQRFELPVSPDAEKIVPSEAYFVVAPGAGWAPRRWPLANFIEIARRVVAENGPRCVVVGDQQDRPFGDAVVQGIGQSCIDTCGRLGIHELAEIVRQAQFVVGNDSAVVHIAAYFGVPSVVALGGGHFNWFLPYPETARGVQSPRVAHLAMSCFGCNWHCRFGVPREGAVPCLEGLGTEAVWREVEPLLRSRAAAPPQR